MERLTLGDVEAYLSSSATAPLFMCADAVTALGSLPDASIDVCMTSPPYWRHRVYHSGGLGQESSVKDYIARLLTFCSALERVLKPTGSFWLNLGDTYDRKGLVGVPWRIALALVDEHGWVLRNDVVWNKMKGPDNARDKLRNTHEYLFHFVRQPHSFYYDVDAVRQVPGATRVRNGTVITATGVSGVKYRAQIESSDSLSATEKQAALLALDSMLGKLKRGEIHDFRMVIREQQRVTHSDSSRVSGRAKELAQKGFYFLTYHPKGSKPNDVWNIVAEDSTRRTDHYAAYPEDLCRIPLMSTCPADGVVLDPFCGTGTTNLVAMTLGHKSVGFDVSQKYIDVATRRCQRLL